MNLTHIRTENGTPALITARAALDEINAGMMGPTKKLVRQMSAVRDSANIEYRDGRKVDIRPATPEELDGMLLVDTVEHVIDHTEDGGATWHQTPGHTYRDKADAEAALLRLAADKRNRGMNFRGASVHLTVTASGKATATRTETRSAPVERTANGLRIVNANGKRYVVSAIRRSAYAPDRVEYWSERNGRRFGATRNAAADDRPGTVAAAIWASVAPGSA